MYLIPPDFTRIIQDQNLSQIITSDQAILTVSTLTAQAEAVAHLRQKYDVSSELRDITPWDKTLTYLAGGRVYLDPATYNATLTYNTGAYALVDTIAYKCIANGTTGAFDATRWTQVGSRYDMYHAVLPHPLFDYQQVYRTGDQVYWHGRTYTCAQPTILAGQDIQFHQLQNIPLSNVFPDDPVSGATAWGAGLAYTVPAATDLLNTTYWALGDTRDPEMVQKIADITLFHLHSRISPKNIPTLRTYRYMGNEHERVIKGNGEIIYPLYSALGWLQGCARGAITPALPLLQPKQGKRIRYGGTIRNTNSY